MSDENLNELLAKRAPKPRSKLTTALAAILVLVIGVLGGSLLASSSQSSTNPAGLPGGPPSGGLPAADGKTSSDPGAQLPGGAQGPGGFGPGGVRPAMGTVDAVDGGTVTITLDGESTLAPGDHVLVINPPAGAPAGISP